MDKEKIVVLIPAYNPTEDLIPLVDKLLKNNFQVVVVNDGSKDETKYIFEKLDKEKITFLVHDKNMGKGQALKTGMEYISKNIKCKGVITADADGQHVIEDIKKIKEAMLDKNNDGRLILGSRLNTSLMPFTSRTGNAITRLIFSFATHKRVFDTQTGLRGIPSSLLDEFILIPGQRYEYEINMLIYVCQHDIDIKEIEIQPIYIDNNKASSFNIVKDSIKIYKCIFKYTSLLSALFYAISAVIAFIIDFTLVIVLKKVFLNTLSNESIALLMAVVLARAVSSIINFTINKKVAFKDNSNVFHALVKYYSLVIVVLILNYAMLNLLNVILGFNLVLSKLLVECILFVFNYIIQKKLIFRKKEAPKI